MARLHGRVAGWFQQTYGQFTPAQTLCIPAILAGRSVLLSSPTGSGKTLAGFLAVIDRLVRERPPPGRIHAVYISPLRSLTYDIQKNLTRPLVEMGLEKDIRIALRTGDTPAKERAQIKQRPPHILLTTPESLAILLAQPGYHGALAACRFVVVDELHALAENKRGAHLSVSLERLERLVAREPGAPGLCRVGLSATISPLETMAGFLVGAGRPCVLAEARGQRRAVIEVFSPVRRNPYPPAGQSTGRVLSELAALIRRKQSVLIFANTRTGAELLGLRLKAALPKLADRIEVHHGSLDRDVRLEVEDRLKNGELRAVVCSSSLEMGVDIGAIDLVVMISAPKGISRTLQRIGRSGHSVGAESHGVLVATNIDDLVECTVTARLARERRLDPVRVPENPADVLVQHLLGLAMEEPGLDVDMAWETVRRAWPFRHLTRADFDRAVEYLRGGGRSLEKTYADTFGKLRVDEAGGMWTVSRKVERDYLVNIGTIASEGLVNVLLGRRRLGSVDEGFVQGLKVGDVFVLGGRVVRLVEVGWQVAKVEDAAGERPNVPTWGGSRLGLSTGLAAEIAGLRGELDDRLGDGDGAVADWLVEAWEISQANAQAIVAQFELQRRHSLVPRAGLTLIELYRETVPENKQVLSHYFFHTMAGRPVNDALSRIVARRLAGVAGGNAQATVNDYGFLLTLARFQELPLSRWQACFARAGAEDDLLAALKESELVRWQFRAVAQTGLMVPRQLPGKDRAIKMLRFSAEILFRVLEQYEPDHPLLAESYRQATTLFLDQEGACAWLERAAAPDWRWRLVETPVVSPFGFGLYVSKWKENLQFENPDEAIERLYQQFYGADEARTEVNS